MAQVEFNGYRFSKDYNVDGSGAGTGKGGVFFMDISLMTEKDIKKRIHELTTISSCGGGYGLSRCRKRS